MLALGNNFEILLFRTSFGFVDVPFVLLFSQRNPPENDQFSHFFTIFKYMAKMSSSTKKRLLWSESKVKPPSIFCTKVRKSLSVETIEYFVPNIQLKS